MAHLGDSDLSERARVIRLTVATSGVVLLTTAIFSVADAWWVFVAMNEQPAPVGAALHIALWSSIMLLLSRTRKILRAVVGVVKLSTAGTVIRYVWRGAVLVCRVALGIIPALLRLLLGDGYYLVAMKVRVWCDPAFRWFDAATGFIAPLTKRVQAIRAALVQERELRRAYRDEFKSHFPSYRGFRAAFYAKGGAERQEAVAVNPFAGACAALGLSADGAFTQQEFKAQYRALMKSVHPDVAGANDRAAAINEAAAVIKKRKDWK